MADEVRVPALGESVSEAVVGSWARSVGDAVQADDVLCELETDKINIEVPSPSSGQLREILVPEGSTVEVGAVLARIEVGATGKAPKASRGGPAMKEEEAAPKPESESDGGNAGTGRADQAVREPGHAPSAKRLMAEHRIDPASVQGTGRDDRIMKEDVQRVIEAGRAAAAAAEHDRQRPLAAEAEEVERVRMTRLRQTIASRLKSAQNTAAMLTTYNEADMSSVMELRAEYKETFLKKHGVRLGFMSFFVKACCTALAEVPEVNAEIDGTDVVYKRFVHMGIAVGTPSGLVVPVVRNAHGMTFAEVEKRIAELGAKARDGRLSLQELQGGTFTISNGGVYGSLMSSPILNPPQSGILGMHKIQERPVAVDGQVAIRPMMYLALSYDHRIVDGKGAVSFLVRVKEAIEDPRRLLMEI